VKRKQRTGRLHLELPELGPLNTKLLGIWAVHIASGQLGTTFSTGRALVTSFLRLTDHALFSYKTARQAYLEGDKAAVLPPDQWTTRERLDSALAAFTSSARATSHLEVAVTSAHRALCFLHDATKIESELRRLVARKEIRRASVRRKLSRLRNAIQHLDERVRDKRLRGNPISPFIRGSYLRIGERRIQPATLVRWLQEMQATGVAIIRHASPPPNISQVA
jgi:hypothetical protein